MITIDDLGCITDFLMNDKCAAGTGRFLEMTMKRVESEIGRIDTFVKDAKPAKINSMCAVFAESEIVGLLAQDIAPGDIVLGCVESIVSEPLHLHRNWRQRIQKYFSLVD